MSFSGQAIEYNELPLTAFPDIAARFTRKVTPEAYHISPKDFREYLRLGMVSSTSLCKECLYPSPKPGEQRRAFLLCALVRIKE
jgi:hypothetical protein